MEKYPFKKGHNMISIIIPAYNEENRLGKTLKTVKNFMVGKEYEIIVVDDGSTDTTVEVAKNAGVVLVENKVNKGKGYSVKNGVMQAKGDYILFSDADLSTPIDELRAFLRLIQEYDLVIGSRGLKESNIQIKQPKYRHFIGKAFNTLVRTLTGLSIKDTQCGFKLFRRDVALKIFPKLTINRWGFDVEILYLAKKFGYKIKEQPVTWLNVEGSKVSPLKDSIKMFFEILKIRWNDLVGRY